MLWFLVRIVFAVITFLFSVSKIIADFKKKRKKSVPAFVVVTASIVLAIWTSFGFGELELSAPEIYTTNGNSAEDNEVYMKVDFPLTIWYTTTRYGEAENGEKYEDSFCIDESLVITAKSTFGGLKWSEAVCVDIVIGDDGTAVVEQQEEPGSSIKEISVAITNHQFFPGDILERDSLYVTGTTIYGEEVVIQNYLYEPMELVEGINVIKVNYKNLEAQISCNITAPQLTGLSVEYIGDILYDGDFILPDYFSVEGIYENGKTETIDVFSVSPQIAENMGEETITITADGISKDIVLEIEPRQEEDDGIYLFSGYYIDCIPDSVFNQINFGYLDAERTDVQGKNREGDLYLFIGEMFNMIQASGDSWRTVTIHFIVNPEYDLSNGLKISGEFVVDRGTLGSEAYTSISIQTDGQEVWHTGEDISGNTIDPTLYSAEIYEGTLEMTMVFKCNALAEGLGLEISMETADIDA